ncbi:unnamed protein product [Acanthoscelides obtectus]|nr:unnamed protein product [Acanthoscelides obtectus]CAK1648129.1 hypothetical protein AOBTE_LOCUS15552 [Acanthoscelides obtectus]
MELVLGAVSRFTSGRTLQLNLDKLTRENLARAIEEGRGKDKKSPMPWVIAGIGLVLLLVPAALGVLAVLATKALVVGKMSLLLSLISFAQYFFASSGGKNVVPSVYATKYVGTYGPPADNGWNGYEPGPAYRRSFAVRTEDSTYANQ